jgi:hypothetical protein
MKRTILPARPLRLRGGVHMKTALLVLLMLAFTVGGALGTTWFVSSGASIGRDKDIWARGLPGADGYINAKRTSKLIPWFIANYDGKVSYADAEGARFEGDIDFWTMFGGPDTDNAELRYDPQHHEHFAINWGVEASGARWRAVIVMTLLCALMTLTFAWGAWIIVQNARNESRVAASGDEVHVRVVSATPHVKEGKPTGKYDYRLELDDGEKPRPIHRVSPWLLTCAPNDARVLGLWMPGKPGSLILITSDFAPLVVNQTERAEINARAEQARAG